MICICCNVVGSSGTWYQVPYDKMDSVLGPSSQRSQAFVSKVLTRKCCGEVVKGFVCSDCRIKYDLFRLKKPDVYISNICLGIYPDDDTDYYGDWDLDLDCEFVL